MCFNVPEEVVKHLKCYRRSGAAAPLTNRDCPLPPRAAPAPRRVSFFQPSPEDRLNVVLRLLYLALNCEALKGHFAWITRGAPSFFSLRPSRLLPLSCFVNTLKVSVGINWPRIRADVNEPSLSLSRRRTVITVEIRDT